MQEAIASAYVSYQLLAAKGTLHAVFAVQAVKSGRHVRGVSGTQ